MSLSTVDTGLGTLAAGPEGPDGHCVPREESHLAGVRPAPRVTCVHNRRRMERTAKVPVNETVTATKEVTGFSEKVLRPGGSVLPVSEMYV